MNGLSPWQLTRVVHGLLLHLLLELDDPLVVVHI